MSRFKRDLAGDFGEYWVKDALEQIAKVKKQYEEGKITIEDGVAYNSIHNVVIEEVAEALEEAIGSKINVKATNEARSEESRKFIEGYRKQQANRKISDEERFEMESAFGRGAEVVDVLTGRIIKL